jgi:tetratricopeptide (TPR) repeat protein
MKKLILESNFEQLNNFFKEKNYDKFEKTFANYEQKNLLCEKSYNLFGVYLSRIENYKLSVSFFEKSINLNNHYSVAKINLAGVFFKLNQHSKAKNLLYEVLSVDEKNIYALRLLANIDSQIKQTEKAEKTLKKIIDYYPVDPQAYYDLGIFFYKSNNFDQAETNFKKTIQLNQDQFLSNYYLALIYKSKNKIKDAEFILISLIKKYPKIRESYFLLSDIYRGKGDFDKSNAVLDKVFNQIDKFDEYSIYQLLASPYYKDKIKIIDHCKKNYASFNDSLKERVGYALFKHFDNIENYSVAAGYLSNSLKITSNRYGYLPNIDNQQFDFFKKTFDENFKNNNLYKSERVQNIFIVGMQRSGSTLLEQILSTHKDMVSFGESPFFADLITKYFPNQSLATFEKDIKNSKKNLFIEIGQEYNKKLNSLKPFTISIDKMLSNFRMIGFIIAAIPDCLIVNIERNKNDNLFSILSNYFENFSAPWSYDEDNLKNYYRNYLSLMKHWKNIYPDKIITITYESLINNPKNEIEQILHKCNIKWSSNFLNFRENKNIVETASVYQVRKSLYNTSLGRWKNYKNYFPKLFKN